tara:strand:- start:540 stop:1520 length:981 start_codon:yes stop_codon:yes gene_type:complete
MSKYLLSGLFPNFVKKTQTQHLAKGPFGEGLDAAELDKARVYLKPGEQAPEGAQVQTGPKGGQYYDDMGGGAVPTDEAQPYPAEAYDQAMDAEVDALSGIPQETTPEQQQALDAQSQAAVQNLLDAIDSPQGGGLPNPSDYSGYGEDWQVDPQNPPMETDIDGKQYSNVNDAGPGIKDVPGLHGAADPVSALGQWDESRKKPEDRNWYDPEETANDLSAQGYELGITTQVVDGVAQPSYGREELYDKDGKLNISIPDRTKPALAEAMRQDLNEQGFDLREPASGDYRPRTSQGETQKMVKMMQKYNVDNRRRDPIVLSNKGGRQRR